MITGSPAPARTTEIAGLAIPAAHHGLLLRTSLCERVNGELADLMTGDSGGEGMLEDPTNAWPSGFIVPVVPKMVNHRDGAVPHL